MSPFHTSFRHSERRTNTHSQLLVLDSNSVAVFYLVLMSPGRASGTGSSPTSGTDDGSTSPPQPPQTALTLSHTVITHTCVHLEAVKISNFCLFSKLRWDWPASSCASPRRTVRPTARTADPAPPSLLYAPGSSGWSSSDWPPVWWTNINSLPAGFGWPEGLFRTHHLGISEAARPLGVNVVLQDALADVVHGFGQTSFPACGRWRTFTQH